MTDDLVERQTDAEVAAIAAGLTKAQRRSLLNPRETIDGRQIVNITCNPWPQGICRFHTANTDTLTPLGLRVAQHLKQENANG